MIVSSKPARRAVHLEHSPNSPYPDAIVAGGLVFTSAVRAQAQEAGFDSLPSPARAKQQGHALADRLEGAVTASAWGSYARMEEILHAAGSDMTQILRQHIWQKDKRLNPCEEAMRIQWQPVPAPSSGIGVTTVPDGTGEQWIGHDAIAVIAGENPLLGERKMVAARDRARLPSASYYSQAMRTGPLIFTAGHIPINTAAPGQPLISSFDDVPEEGRFLATGRSHPDSRDGPIAAQTWYVYNELFNAIAEAGARPEDVVLSTVYLADLRDFPVFHRVHAHMFGDRLPALAVMGFDQIGHRGCLIEIELTALDATGDLDLVRVDWPKIRPFAAPAAIRTGPFAFFSGICGFDQTGAVVTDATALPEPSRSEAARFDALALDGVGAQTFTAVARLEEAMQAAGGTLSDLVKVTAYIRNSTDRAIIDAALSARIPTASLPAFECIAVQGPGPTPEAEIQLEAIGFISVD
jgi:enamine deaminase RidA (YjgF/YER057c/UK114 family)